MSSSQRIPVEPNSLYVTTSALAADGRFHWSVIHVDEYGRCTKHHWMAVSSDSAGREAYIRRSLAYGALNATPNQAVLAYFKISEYRPIQSADLEATCATIFPYSYQTAAQNRAYGISCRTWTISLLSRLFSPERASQIEMMVIRHSTAYSNQFATAFLHGRPYTTAVVAI